MNFSQNPDVYIKKQARIRNQRPPNYKVHNHLFLNFFKVENLLHCDNYEITVMRTTTITTMTQQYEMFLETRCYY